MDRSKYLVILAATYVFASMCGATFGSEPASEADVKNSVLAEFKIATEGDVLLVPVDIDTQRCLFLVDTGSATNVIDSKLARSLAPLRSSSRRYPSGFPSMYEFPNARLSDTSIAVTDDAAIVDLSELRRMSGYPIQGMLGISFLRRFVVDIDFDNGVLQFLDVDTAPKPKSIRITRDPHQRPVLVVELTMDETTPFLIDTGMALPGVGEFKARTFDEMLQAGRLRPLDHETKVATVSGVVTRRKAVFDTFRIGPFEHHGLRVTAGSVNAVGLRLLSRYHVRFDFAHERGWFEPGSRFDAEPIFDASGLTIARDEGKTFVLSVAANSPAETAGFRSGDELLRFNQRPLRDQTLFKIRKALCREGTTLSVERFQNDKTEVVPLTLSDWQKRRAIMDVVAE